MTTDWAVIAERQRERRLQRARAALSAANDEMLETPEAQPILARVGAAIDPDYPDRIEHARNVTLVVLKARQSGRNVHEHIRGAA